VQFEWAGGGFVMNPVDLAKAGKLVYEGKVFSKKLLPEFFKGIDAKRQGGTWGLGVHIRKTPMGMTYGHSGFFPGYLTNMLYFPEAKFSIAFQVNTTNPKNISLYRKMFKFTSTIQKYISE
jgi:D-alanyl-D-alanine carboxypeptidase